MEEIEQLKRRIEALEKFVADMQAGHSIPWDVEGALRSRLGLGSTSILSVAKGGTGVATLTGIVKASGTSAFTAVVPLAGTKSYWVSDTLTGPITRNLTFTNGILTAET